MKKLVFLLVVLLPLCGCAKTDYETVVDGYVPGPLEPPQKMLLDLPEEAAAFTALSDGSRLYFCEGYEIMLETFRSGDLDATLRSVTGYSKEALTVLETKKNGMNCAECAWTSAGDEGQRVGRTVVLDDGVYHYCLTLTAAAVDAGSLQTVWQDVSLSFTVES